MPEVSPKLAWSAVKPMFTNNIGLKLFSLACAIALYAFVHGAQDAQRIMAVDLVVLLPPASENRTLSTDLPTSVRVSLHGPRSLVADLRPSDLGNMQLDLRSGRSGRIPLEPGMLRVPGGVTIDSIDPSALDISWDDLVEKTIKVQIPVTGLPAEGFVQKGRPSAAPDALQARGPSQIVDNLQYVQAEAFDVTNLKTGTHQRTLVIDRAPPRVSYDISHTTATVEIVRKMRERVFSEVVVRVVGVPRADTEPNQVDVRVVGPPEVVSELRAGQIVPHVTVPDDQINPNQGNSLFLPVEVDLQDVEASCRPKSVVVTW